MTPADADGMLMAVVGAVADGLPVDWSRAESTPLNDEQRSVLAQLKVLERLHRLHQSGTPSPSSSSPSPSSATSDAVDAPRGGEPTSDDEEQKAETNVSTA